RGAELVVRGGDDERAVRDRRELLRGEPDRAQRHADERDPVRVAALLDPAERRERAERIRGDADRQLGERVARVRDGVGDIAPLLDAAGPLAVAGADAAE